VAARPEPARRPRIDPPEEPPKRGWMRVLMWLAAVPLLCISCSVGSFFFVRSQSPYDDAVAKAIGDARVQKALGTPISAASAFSGRTSGSGVFAGSGQAKMDIGLDGSKQSGTLHLEAVKTSGLWGFSKLEVRTSEGKTIDLSYHPR